MIAKEIRDQYEPTIGIECHVQLSTKTKLFSSVDNDARDAEPNSKVSEIDYALPGMLPMLNREAIRLAARAGYALKAKIANVSRFDRKHYFYPDLPKGYQTTQMYQPIILAGQVDLPSGVTVRIHHAHLEEDAGKLTHINGYSLVDLNRAGTPLIEIVSEPDIHSAKDAKAYAQELHALMTYADVTNGDLYYGNMRFDVNVSVAKKKSGVLGIRAEVKNLNSFRSVERAVEYEIDRQIELLENGERVVQETRGWHDAKQITISQRSKEDAQDYRYMPDADIPPIILTDDEIADFQADMPMMPDEYRQKFAVLEVDHSVINAILADKNRAERMNEVLDNSDYDTVKRVANWFASSFANDDPEKLDLRLPSANNLIKLSAMVADNELSSTAAKDVFAEMLILDKNPHEIAEDKNLLQVSDESEIALVVDEVMNDPISAKAVADIRSGNDKAIGFLVGQVMKRSKGKANPALAQKLIRDRL